MAVLPNTEFANVFLPDLVFWSPPPPKPWDYCCSVCVYLCRLPFVGCNLPEVLAHTGLRPGTPPSLRPAGDVPQSRKPPQSPHALEQGQQHTHRTQTHPERRVDTRKTERIGRRVNDIKVRL